MDNPTEQISALSIQLGGLDAELDVAKRKLKDLQTQVDANKDSEESKLSELNDCVRQLAHSSRKLQLLLSSPHEATLTVASIRSTFACNSESCLFGGFQRIA